MLEKDWLDIEKRLKAEGLTPMVIAAFRACYFAGVAAAFSSFDLIAEIPGEKGLKAYMELRNEAAAGIVEPLFCKPEENQNAGSARRDH